MRKRTRRRHIVGPVVHPVTRALLVRDWENGSLDAEIHAWTGDNSDAMVNAAGRRYYVALGAAALQGIGQDDPDVRVIRGAVNAMGEQAGEQVIDANRRASIVAGLMAVRRIQERVKLQHIGDAAVDLAIKLKFGDVMLSDFEAMTKPATSPQT